MMNATSRAKDEVESLKGENGYEARDRLWVEQSSHLVRSDFRFRFQELVSWVWGEPRKLHSTKPEKLNYAIWLLTGS